MITKKPILKFMIAAGLVALVILPSISFAKVDTVLKKYSGKVVVQTEDKNKTWYIDPIKKEKYPLNNAKDAVAIMQKSGVGISNKDINRIKLPTSKYSNWKDYGFAKSISGRIFVQVQDKGQAWYIDPINFRKYYLGSGENALKVLKNLSVKAKTSEINNIKTGNIAIATVKTASTKSIQEIANESIIVPETRSLSLAISRTNGASGSVTMVQNDQNITYAKNDFVKTYVLNSEVVLYPTADYGYKFIGWGGDCFQSGESSCKLKVSKDLNVTAYFSTITPVYSGGSSNGGSSTTSNPSTPINPPLTPTTPIVPIITKYNLNISKLGSGSGIINNSVLSSHYSGSQDYDENTSITLTATSNADSNFLGWTGDVCLGNANTCTFIMNKNINVMATFASKPKITLLQLLGGNVSINPNKSYYENNETATLTATASNGYIFTKWLGDCMGAGANPTCTLTMNGGKNVSALFSSATVQR